MKALPYILCAILLAGVVILGYLLWKRWDHVPPPLKDEVTAEARLDSLEQVEHNARGDALLARDRTIQHLRDSLDLLGKPVKTRVHENAKAMDGAPAAAYIDSLELQPTYGQTVDTAHR